MEAVFAAPESFLPSALTALASQASCVHFFMKEVLAAPASGLPSLPTALASQDASCAKAEPAAKVAISAIYRPDPAARSTYDELYREFRNIYKNNKGIHARLNGS